jgi:tape measure domain-containing protein
MTDKIIRIKLDSSGAKRNAQDLDKSIKGVGKSADSTIFTMSRLAAAIAAVISVQKIKEYSDAWTGVTNQLRQTVKTQEQLAAVTQRIVDISIESRASLEATSQLYTRFRLSVDETTLSNERLFGIVETINKSLALSGATASESAGALRQLSQAIASGVLRGEEFNSIAEQAPGIFQAIQKETGKTAGELRKFAADGGITTDILIRSLEAYRSTVDDQFGKSKATISQAFEVARTNITQFIGTLDQASGASASFAQMIIDVSNTVNSPEVVGGLIEFFKLASLTIDSVTNSLSEFDEQFAKIAGTTGESASFIGQAFKNILPNIKAMVEVLTVEAIATIDKLRVSAVALYEVLSSPFDEEATKAAMLEYERGLATIKDARERGLQDIFDERGAIIETAAAEAKAVKDKIALNKELAASVPSGITPSFSGGVTFGSSAGKKEAKASDAAEEISAARAVTEGLKLELDTRRQISDAYKESAKVSATDTYEYERALLQARMVEEKAIADQRMTEDAQRREEQRRLALEDSALTQEEKFVIGQYYDEQERLQRELHQETLNSIEQKGADERLRIAEAERIAKQQLVFDMLSSGVALLEAFGSKSSKSQKRFARLSIAADTAQGVAKGVALGWPLGIPAVAWAIATGKVALDRLNSGGGGGGGNIPTAASIPKQEAPALSNQPAFQQKQVIEVRGINPDSLVTGQQLIDIMQANDNVIVALSGAQADAQRRGVI